MLAEPTKASTRLKELIHRKDKVLVVLHPPSAAHARVMEAAGCEAGFVGTGGVVGAYTGMDDVGQATMMECIQIAGWIAESVKFPIILDGDTGHGGIMAVRRLIRECIRHGIAGIRIDDQPIEGKRKTQSAGVEVVPIEQAVARYRAAVDMKNELDPDFIIQAQCYARDAANSSLEDSLTRLKAYEQDAGVDWVQLESPHSKEEISQARDVVKGPLSFMKGKLYDYMLDFNDRGMVAWEEFEESRKGKPYPIPKVGPEGEGQAKQMELEKKYFSAEMLAKYKS
jgi:2-methylisocitrate lyase-like PEP mutase family enzyme